MGDGPTKLKQQTWGLMGKDAYASGKRWGHAQRSKRSAEEIAAFVRKLGKPTDDYDKGVLEGLTNG